MKLFVSLSLISTSFALFANEEKATDCIQEIVIADSSEEEMSTLPKVEEEIVTVDVEAVLSETVASEDLLESFSDEDCESTISTEAVLGEGEAIEMEAWSLIDVSSVQMEHLVGMVDGSLPNTVLVFSEGTILPIRFFLNGNLLTLVDQEGDFGYVEVQQAFYGRFSTTGIDLSADLETWSPFFEFVTGIASIQLSVEDGKAFILFGAEANRRV